MRGDEAGRDRDVIDERIDAALRSYAEPAEVPEARVVLARVMERARASERQRRGWWMWGAVTAAGLAVVVLAGMVWLMRGPRQSEIAWTPKALGVVGNIPQRLKPELSGHVHGRAEAVPLQSRGTTRRESRAEAASLPKKEVFPTPRPLSVEEQALVAFANDVPAKVQQQVIEAEKHVGDPIVIAELKIASLGGGEKQDSDEQEKDKER